MNDIQILDGATYLKMIKCGAANLNRNRTAVNELNVFPVPDGDTGDNMFMTINSGAVWDGGDNLAIDKVSGEIAHRMLLGARGNSGVILSKIFSGIAKGFSGCTEADIPTLANALECGVKEAYGSVYSPVEGTILTVCRESVEYANSLLSETKTVCGYFENLIEKAQKSLEKTPELLKVLADAGVVDSGGAGFLFICDGMKNALDGGDIASDDLQTNKAVVTLDFSAFDENSECDFGYCTELLLRLQNKKVDIASFDERVISDFLTGVGESVVCVRSDSIIKIHVHTKTPGDVLCECQKYGEFLTVKIENMQLQHNGIAKKKKAKPAVKPRRKFASVVCCNGKGMKDIFTSLGCDYIIDGGQCMNPSTKDFMTAFESVNADTVFVFPNNKNIIMAAKQAAALYEDSDIRVVNTKTVGEGYAAFSMLDTTSGDADKIVKELDEVALGVLTGAVCHSTRTAHMDGVDIEKGDYIGIAGGKILCDAGKCTDAVKMLCEKADASKYDIVIILCGEDSKADEADELYGYLQKKYPRTEMIMLRADQGVYDYILIFE